MASTEPKVKLTVKLPWFLDSVKIPMWFYLPNLIGYVRVIALAYAIAAPDSASAEAIRALLLSLALDFIDGPAARALRMCTQFGDLLDHFTDHATMFYLVAITTNSRLDYAINAFHCAVAFGYMCVRGHYFKHSAGGNAVTRAIEQNNYFNMPSMLWNANTGLIPLVKLSYALEHGVPLSSSTELLNIINALGAIVTLAYSIAVLIPEGSSEKGAAKATAAADGRFLSQRFRRVCARFGSQGVPARPAH